MEKLIITDKNSGDLGPIASALAKTYKIAFAGEPWFEVSKCLNEECLEGFSPEKADSICICGSCRAEAYNRDELVNDWDKVISEESGFMEVAFIGSSPVRATIARPTTPTELFARKYSNAPLMETWLNNNMPPEFVWIEDTFADRERSPEGNLRDRGKTIKAIWDNYGNLSIATRTLAPQIVAATLRDCFSSTRVFMGSDKAGSDIVNRTFNNPGYPLPVLPDRRTLLTIGRST